ncbi:MAG: 4-hydroxy-tetrahydrodipicolinate synthase [Fibrobacteres bacterium]|nr:4-hydroxy-tetrahydrodipicolinate synthase [Fibrobacterota bacterium]
MAFTGTYIALVTPFTKDNKINVEKLKEMVEFHVKNGTDGLVPCGTTGESPTLSWDENKLVVKTVVEAAKGRLKVVAGTGSNCTEEAMEATKFAKTIGADAALIVSPYYNKPTQEGLYRHFKLIAEECDIPVMVYNILGRTGVNIETSTMARLAKVKNIKAVKEASGNINQISDVIVSCPELDVLSGDDSLTLPLMAVGGKGIVSVVGNIIPFELKSLVNAINKGDMTKAKEIHQKLFPLCQSMFLETNPIPIREAMNLLGWDVGAARMPLTPMSDAPKQKLIQEMKAFGLKVNV